MLGDDARVAKLLHMLQPWLPTCHAEAPHFLQSIKIEMPKSLMPAPSNIITMCRETYWSGNLKIDDVETIPAAPNPNKELTLLVPYAKHTSPDQHTCVALVKLANADNRVLQAWDVVDATESLVFSVSASEDDGADALDFDN